jgi:glycosyltransferase involved in cell wall biosynthesis
MKVSVVITTYNRASYIRQAIDSVLGQTMRDFELIVVDDGSTDGTGDVVAGYGDRVRYLRTANGGPARARNAGLASCRGDYLCWLDSDDCFEPDKLALQCAVLDARPDVGMVYTEMIGFDDHGMRDDFHLRRYHASAYQRGGVRYESLFDGSWPLEEIAPLRAALPHDRSWPGRRLYVGRIFDQYLANIVVFTNSMLFRRGLYEAVGPQRPRFGMFHDLEFALRLAREGPVAFLDVPTYALRYHPDQISTTAGPRAAWIAIGKQQDLLRVFRVHAMQDRRYYDAHRQAVDRQFSRLCRAVAILLLAYDYRSAHQRRWFPRRARVYLRQAAHRGHAWRLLTCASYLPHWPRRVLMKCEALWRGALARLTS